MAIGIIADSTCDLSKELTDKYGITIVPLSIIKGAESLKDGVEICPSNIFEYIEKGAGVCYTTAVNIEEYAECFKKELETKEALIHFTISSDMSTCYQNACIAAEDMENVYIVDSKSLSTGIGHLVIDAAVLASEGLSVKTIYEILKAKRDKLEVSFLINTLKYLHKGGHCSALSALGTNLLQLKPCIEVAEGNMEVGKKYRGHFDKCVLQYVEDKLKGREDIDYRRIFITHSAEEKVVNAVKAKILELGPFEEVIETNTGCTVSCHCGPNCLGLLFYKK